MQSHTPHSQPLNLVCLLSAACVQRPCISFSFWKSMTLQRLALQLFFNSFVFSNGLADHFSVALELIWPGGHGWCAARPAVRKALLWICARLGPGGEPPRCQAHICSPNSLAWGSAATAFHGWRGDQCETDRGRPRCSGVQQGGCERMKRQGPRSADPFIQAALLGHCFV